MLLEVTKMYETSDRTVSILKVNGTDFCFILEDGYREVKVPGETRIPAGRYPVTPKKTGSFFKEYKSKYGHSFSISVDNVPGFEGILIHIGNWPQDTRGCLLVGLDVSFVTGYRNLFIQRSTEAYKRLYKIVAEAFQKGEQVEIDIKR